MSNAYHQKPLISVITVCYNSAKTISKTIDSVLNQTYNNIEYIVVDGKSTDSTMEIVKSYELQFKEKNIAYRYISEIDNGIYEAMNKGIKFARGKWIGIINSDDWYEVDACEQLVISLNGIKKFEIFAGSIKRFFYVDNHTYYQITTPSLDQINVKMTLCHPAVFVKANLYTDALFDVSYKIMADWALMKYFVNKNVQFLLTDKRLANFTEGGISSKRTWGFYREWIRVLKSTHRFLAYYLVGKVIFRKEILALLKPIWLTKYRQQKILQRFYIKE